MLALKRHHYYLLIIPFICACYCFIFYVRNLPPYDVMWVRMQDYNERNEHEKMRAAYEKLVKKYPDNAALLYPYGWALYKTGHYAEAAAVINEYAERNPFYVPWRQRYIDRIRKKAAGNS